MAQQTNTQMNEKVPTNYTLCIKGDCPKAETCLHHVATQMMPAEIQKWSILSPTYLAQIAGECPHYRSAEKVQYARGFVLAVPVMHIDASHTLEA
jgi:hypothetical protein